MPNINELPPHHYEGTALIPGADVPMSRWSQQDKDYSPGAVPGHIENDTLTAVFAGNANAPPDVYFGGTPDAANLASEYYQNMGNATFGQAAPVIGSGGRDVINNQISQGNKYARNAYAQGNAAADQQNAAMGYLANAAAGKGPSAAQAQLQAGTDQGIAAQMAMANSARGQAGIANAQKNALGQGAQMMQTGANQAAQLRAQEMQAAQNAYAQSANQMQNQYANQALGYQGQTYQGAGMLQQGDISQAGLQAGQNALNQQGQMGYEQMSFNAQQAALQAQQQNQALRYNLNIHNADKAKETGDSLMSMMGGGMLSAFSDARAKQNIEDAGPGLDEALNNLRPYNFEYKDGFGQAPGRKTGIMAQDLAATDAGSSLIGAHPSGGMAIKGPEGLGFALASVGRLNERLNKLEHGSGGASGQFGDAQFREPGGDAAYTLREMPDFMLVKNDRTGEMRKMATEPLSQGEKKEALHAPHGAGPIDGRRVPSNGTYGDMGIGSIMGMAGGLMGGGKDKPAPSPPPQLPQQLPMMGAIGGSPVQPLGAQAAPQAPVTPAAKLNAAAGIMAGPTDEYGNPLQFGAGV